MDNALLKVEDLHTHFISKRLTVKAVNGVDFTLGRQSVVALVGESGSGKTTTALSIMGILPSSGKVVRGRMLFDRVDLLALPEEERRMMRGKEMSMVFQHPMAALSPLNTVRKQLEEGILAHGYVPPKELRGMCEALLGEMGLPDPRRVLDSYPFQLSGGMCQRVVLAIAMALRPKLLIADEPTSDLDLTIQAQILARLKWLMREFHTSILFITHDLGIVAYMAQEVVVLYGGRTVERAPVRTLFDRPLFPYSWMLLQTFAALQGTQRQSHLLSERPAGYVTPEEYCPFLHRCPKAISRCRLEPPPPLEELEPDHWVACYNPMSYH